MKCLILTTAEMSVDEIIGYFSKKFPDMNDEDFKIMLNNFLAGKSIEVSKDLTWTTTIQTMEKIQ